MAFDAFYLSAVLGEMEEKCQQARVEKIFQPSRDTLIFLLRCKEGREKLLIAANPTAPRLHLTTASPENPPEPPMFCMLLRKHLMGARLSAICQTPMERAVEFTFDCTDEMGYPIRKKPVWWWSSWAGPATYTCWGRRTGSWTACAGWVWTKPAALPCRGSTISHPGGWKSKTPGACPRKALSGFSVARERIFWLTG